MKPLDYQLLIDLIARKNFGNTFTQRQVAGLLQSLQEPMRGLWKSFRQDHVLVDYSQPRIQECYLLRYFLQYVFSSYSFLYNAFSQPETKPLFSLNDLSVLFLGPGPGPEIYALMDIILYGGGKRFNIEKLTIMEVDINRNWSCANKILVSQWQSYRRVFESKGIQFKFHSITKDLTTTNLSFQKKANIIFAQNFFNEVVHSINAQNFLRSVLGASSPDLSFFFFSERQGYDPVQLFFNDLETLLGASFIMNSNTSTRWQGQIPELLINNLFDGTTGLIPTRNVRSNWRVIRYK